MGQDNPKKEKTPHRKVIIEATGILVLIALILVILGYSFLKIYYRYGISDLISDVVGNLIGVLAAFLLFDILYNQLTQDAYTKVLPHTWTNGISPVSSWMV